MLRFLKKDKVAKSVHFPLSIIKVRLPRNKFIFPAPSEHFPEIPA